MNCNGFREMLDPYLEDSLEEERRRWFRRHLRECSGCRGWALGRDPSLLFALADAAPAEPARVEACAMAVTAQIRQQRLTRRLHHRRRPWLAAAAAAVVAIGGSLAWRAILSDDGSPEGPVIEAQIEGDAASPPTIEVEMAGDDVRVYQFAADGDDDTAVYFVVNPAMEL